MTTAASVSTDRSTETITLTKRETSTNESQTMVSAGADENETLCASRCAPDTRSPPCAYSLHLWIKPCVLLIATEETQGLTSNT
ncbi:hypothetical protein JOB18_039635 [Solea senegalensis]|uniref:Uncharacterized protein n=1 Tax=Solea senegalensis TaxID=28829 RepID=A0AAV6QN90_SOLSE|nr:hypothetical protein JOB18_039635 [Solea senegalensis]